MLLELLKSGTAIKFPERWFSVHTCVQKEWYAALLAKGCSIVPALADLKKVSKLSRKTQVDLAGSPKLSGVHSPARNDANPVRRATLRNR